MDVDFMRGGEGWGDGCPNLGEAVKYWFFAEGCWSYEGARFIV